MVAIACALFTGPVSADAQTPPQFEAYPAGPVYGGPKTALKLKRGTEAWHFRTMIREGYRAKPVNFAGHYVAIEWGCGAPCQQWAIVDARSGIVYSVPFSTGGEADYRVDSRLFVADPAQCKGEECEGSSALRALYRGDFAVYYRWDGHKLEEVYSAQNAHDRKDAGTQQPPASNPPLQPTRRTAPRG